MKSLLLALSIIFSTQSFANEKNITELLAILIADGTYVGKDGNNDCEVVVAQKSANVTGIIIKNSNGNALFTLNNKSLNNSFDYKTYTLSATESLRSPFFLNGGTLILTVKPTRDTLNFSISTIALDHKGNDLSKFNACSVLK